MKSILKPLVVPLLGLTLGLGFALIFTFFAGENPLHIFWVLCQSAFGSRYDLGLTLFYSTPLIFAGLAVALAAHGGLFNIGAEGQLTLGALAGASFGALFPDIGFPLAPILATAAAMLAGGLWGFIPGSLKVFRGSHEVINTIMLNFIAAGIASWVTIYLLPNPNSQNPETLPVGEAYKVYLHDPISHFFVDTPMSSAFLLALITAVVLWLWLYKTKSGFELRAVGQNEEAARFAGIRVGKYKILSITLGGALAGLVATSEVLGSAGQFKLGFSPGYGFLAIAVSLLARNSPLGIIFTGLLFGALQKGASSLDLETDHITRDFSSIIQALIILWVSAHGLYAYLQKQFKTRIS